MNANPCPPESTLRSLLLGLLAEEDCVALEEHISSCRHCELAIEKFDADEDSLIGQLDGIPFHAGKSESADESDASIDVLQTALAAVAARNVSISDASHLGPLPHGTGLTDSKPSIIGDYEVLATLGRGGMGVVYLARHRSLGRHVALKVLSERRWQDESAVARFTREMKIVGKMQHPAMISATDAGKADDIHYLVMELVDGLDLRLVSKRLGPFAPDRISDACELIRQAAVGMQYAHEQGIVHRDVKPSNLMLDGTGKVKVLDLGLATLNGFEGTVDRLTTIGQLLGTLDYMAPEQCEGLASGEVASDIYGLGATLYKLLSGEPPYGTSDSSPLIRLRQMATMEPPSIGERVPDLDPKLVEVVDRCLNRSVGERYSNAAELASQLEPFCRGHDLVPVLDQARKLAKPDEDRPSHSEVDREFHCAASDIRKYRKRLQHKQNWRSAVMVALFIMIGPGLLGLIYFSQLNQTSRNAAGPALNNENDAASPTSNAAIRESSRADNAPTPENGEPKHNPVLAKQATDPVNSSQEAKATLVINAPFTGVRLKLLSDDKVVKEWTTQSNTESINVPPGEYFLRQLTHTQRLKLSASRLQLKANTSQLIALNRLVAEDSFVEGQLVIDVEGVDKEEVEFYRRRLGSGQSKAVFTSDAQSLVVRGRKNELDAIEFYQNNIAARTMTGLTVGSTANKTNTFTSFESVYLNTPVDRDSDFVESHQLTMIKRGENSFGAADFQHGLLRTKSIGVPGLVMSIAVKKDRLLITCQKPVGDLNEGRSQLIIARRDLGSIIQRFNFPDAPFTVYASSADNSFFYRVIEEYGKPIRLQQYDLTTFKQLKEIDLHEAVKRSDRKFIGISADGTRLLFNTGHDEPSVWDICDFNESTMSFSPLRRIESRDRQLLTSKRSPIRAGMDQASVVAPSIFDPELRACVIPGTLAIHPTKDIVGFLEDDGLVVRRLSDQKELLKIKKDQKWYWKKIAWTNKGKELALMYDNRLRLIDITKLVEGQPNRIEFEPLTVPVNAKVGQEWKLKLKTSIPTHLPGDLTLKDRSFRLIEGPEGMIIRDNELAWTADGSIVAAQKVVVEVTGQIVSTKRPGLIKPSGAEGRLEFEIFSIRPYFAVDRNLRLTQISEDGKYVLLTERERRRFKSDKVARMNVIGAETGKSLVDSEFVHDAEKFVFVQDYLFVFFRDHDQAMRFNLSDGVAKTFPLDLGADLNATRTKTGLPFEKRNAPNNIPPPKHLFPDDVVVAGDELQLNYKHGYWLSEWSNVLSVRDTLNVHDLKIRKQHRLIGPETHVQISISPSGYRQHGKRLFDASTGKVVHNFASHWLPPLTFDEDRIKSLGDYDGTFAGKRLRGANFGKPLPQPKIVRKNRQVSLDWNGKLTPLFNEKSGRRSWGGFCLGNTNAAACKLTPNRLFVIQYSPNSKLAGADSAMNDVATKGKGWHDIWDFHANPLIVGADSVVRLKPPTKKEIDQVSIELVGTDSHVVWDGNRIIVDIPRIVDEFLEVCRDRKLSYTDRESLRRHNDHMKRFLSVFDDRILFEEISGQPLPDNSLAFQYPIRYRLNISATDQWDAIEEIIHTNLIIIVPKQEFDFLPRHKSMKSK